MATRLGTDGFDKSPVTGSGELAATREAASPPDAGPHHAGGESYAFSITTGPNGTLIFTDETGSYAYNADTYVARCSQPAGPSAPVDVDGAAHFDAIVQGATLADLFAAAALQSGAGLALRAALDETDQQDKALLTEGGASGGAHVSVWQGSDLSLERANGLEHITDFGVGERLDVTQFMKADWVVVDDALRIASIDSSSKTVLDAESTSTFTDVVIADVTHGLSMDDMGDHAAAITI